MTITIGLWIIPTLLTAFLLGMMFRPWHSTGDYDFSYGLRVLWLIPVLAVWCAYFALMLWLKK